MTLKELKESISRLDESYDELEVVIPNNKRSMGPIGTTKVTGIYQGIDWNSGYLIICPEVKMEEAETIVGNDGFEFDNSSTIPPTKGLCDAKSIYGSELNKELTLDERMHLWFESSRPNRDVCDFVDEMNDIDKAKYLDECGISRTTKN